MAQINTYSTIVSLLDLCYVKEYTQPINLIKKFSDSYNLNSFKSKLNIKKECFSGRIMNVVK